VVLFRIGMQVLSRFFLRHCHISLPLGDGQV
jgi:hypothetical protein